MKTNEPEVIESLDDLDALAMSVETADEGDDGFSIVTVEETPADLIAADDVVEAAATKKSKKKPANKAAKADKKAAKKAAMLSKEPKPAAKKAKKNATKSSDDTVIEPAPVETKADKKPAKVKIDRPTRDAAAAIIGQGVYDAIVAAASDAKLAKKVAEKVHNTLDAIAGRRQTASVYTKVALDMLEKDGTLTSTGLVKMLEERGYSPGTARAQAQQQMALLPMLGIVTRDKATLTLDAESTVLAALKRAA